MGLQALERMGFQSVVGGLIQDADVATDGPPSFQAFRPKRSNVWKFDTVIRNVWTLPTATNDAENLSSIDTLADDIIVSIRNAVQSWFVGSGAGWEFNWSTAILNGGIQDLYSTVHDSNIYVGSAQTLGLADTSAYKLDSSGNITWSVAITPNDLPILSLTRWITFDLAANNNGVWFAGNGTRSDGRRISVAKLALSNGAIIWDRGTDNSMNGVGLHTNGKSAVGGTLSRLGTPGTPPVVPNSTVWILDTLGIVTHAHNSTIEVTTIESNDTYVWAAQVDGKVLKFDWALSQQWSVDVDGFSVINDMELDGSGGVWVIGFGDDGNPTGAIHLDEDGDEIERVYVPMGAPAMTYDGALDSDGFLYLAGRWS